MYIGLLGPLLVSTNGQPVEVTAAKQRSLLAALAVRAGDVVPVDALAEAIWDAESPATWRGTLRNYVRRLRRALGEDAGRQVITSGPGYLLQADRGELDLLAFEELARIGLAAGAAGDLPTAAAKLGEAEALWRGTPFADIPSRRIRDEHLPYLEEKRLAVLEARIDADLQLSRLPAASVVPELQRLVARHPARERFRSLLMLALYRSGRQADALALFRLTRKFMVDELGVEPGYDLRKLHQRILAGDPDLLIQP